MQTVEDIWSDPNLIKVLNDGGVAVMPTDTLYGIVGRAEDASVVNRIYALRKRNPEKPCIILIGDISEIEKFSISLSPEQKNALKEFWPGPVSVILDCPIDSFEYLHRGMKSLALRLPASEALRNLLMQTGPLVAPSANHEGLAPAKNIDEARGYFKDGVDIYMDAGEIQGKASKLVRLSNDGSTSILRE